jgi:hypothetical protein
MLFQRETTAPLHVGWTPLTSGTSSGHECFLAVKPNQPEDDGEYGVPDVALPNVALPIACGQRGCLTKNPQSARPLVRGHEREANGTKQDERGDHGGQDGLSAWRLCRQFSQNGNCLLTRFMDDRVAAWRAAETRELLAYRTALASGGLSLPPKMCSLCTAACVHVSARSV